MKHHKKKTEQITVNEHWQRVCCFLMHVKGIREIEISNGEMVDTAKRCPPGERPYSITIGNPRGFKLLLAYSKAEADELVAKYKE